MLSGVCSGFVTAFLQTKLGIESILAGIIVNTQDSTRSILRVMGFASNVNLFNCDTIFSMAKDAIGGSWYKLLVAVLIVLIVGILLAVFLNTRLGLSIRATGDNPDMVKASSINPAFTITVGLCVANAMTALSGRTGAVPEICDINLGTGMVTIALASLIIGESIIGKGSMLRRVVGVVLGSCLYRFIVAVALRLSIPAECLKLVSALIVAVAIAFPYLKKKAAFMRQRTVSQNRYRNGGES